MTPAKEARSKPRNPIENNSGERILDVASALFARYGYSGTSIAMIMSGAGVTAPSLCWHFKSKDSLFAAVIKEDALRFFDRAEQLSQDLAAVMDDCEQVAMIERALSADMSFLRAMIMAGLTEDVMASEDIRACVADVRKIALATWKGKCRAYLRAYPAEIAETIAAEYAEVGLGLFEGAFIARGLDGYSRIASVMREFKMHFRAALEHGVAPELLKKVLLQSAIYCGVPAANAAFHQAVEVFA